MSETSTRGIIVKVVINRDFGAFGLSEKAENLYYRLSEKSESDVRWYDIYRSDPILVQVVEDLGSEANDEWSNLKVVEIPDDVDWMILEYDGKEWVAEKHRTWR